MDSLPQPVFRQSVALLDKHFEYASPGHGDVWSFNFEPLSERFVPGQYVHFKLEDPDLDKPVRHISFASAPSDPQLSFCFHLRPESPFKQALARLEPGQRVSLFKFKGAFTLPAADTDEARRPVVLVAGGIGIAPFRSMLRELRIGEAARPAAHRAGDWEALSLLHVSRDGFLYRDELGALPLRQQTSGREGFGPALEALARQQPDALFYIAGATGFVNAAREQLARLGIAEAQIRLDDFEGYAEL